MKGQNGGRACPDKEALLEALLTGELDEAEREALEHHLHVCAKCREALEDARRGLRALLSVSDPLLPYHEPGEGLDRSQSDVAWVDFLGRLRWGHDLEVGSHGCPRGFRHPAVGVAAAAALLVIGFLGGRGIGPPAESVATTSAGAQTPAAPGGLDVLRVDDHAVEALARAELLSDVGLSYIGGVRDLLDELRGLAPSGLTYGEEAFLRERARELVRDGRLLRRNLDAGRDGALVDFIQRAEILLEDLAGLDPGATDSEVQALQAVLAQSGLPSRLSRLDVEAKVAQALEASGWVGKEWIERKEF